MDKITTTEEHKEKVEGLTKDFHDILERMKTVPKQLKQIDDAVKDLEEGTGIDIEMCKLQIKDFEFKINNFGVLSDKAKYKFELEPEWVQNQVDIIQQLKVKEEFKLKAMRKTLVMNKSELLSNKVELDKQMDRCQSHHKVALKQLKDECEVSNGEIQALKNKCPHPCCR